MRIRKLQVLALMVLVCGSIWGQEEIIHKITWVKSDVSNNFDPTYFYREDDSTDVAKLKLRMGDESSSLFEVGFNYCNESDKWYRNFSISGSGTGYFRSTLGIGTTAPQVALYVVGDIDVAHNIKAQEIEVTIASIDDMQLTGTLAANKITLTADFVFVDDYALKPLSEVEYFINANKHLPVIPLVLLKWKNKALI